MITCRETSTFQLFLDHNIFNQSGILVTVASSGIAGQITDSIIIASSGIAGQITDSAMITAVCKPPADRHLEGCLMAYTTSKVVFTILGIYHGIYKIGRWYISWF
jgi:hypothetical protein